MSADRWPPGRLAACLPTADREEDTVLGSAVAVPDLGWAETTWYGCMVPSSGNMLSVT
jgi:hypothetical protein